MAKIGEGHLSAMARLGLKEVRGAMYTGSNVAQPSEYGIFGTKTPGEVAEDRRDNGRNLEEESTPASASMVNERLKQGESRISQRESMSMDMDR
jgi:hypothetical protein